MRFRRPRNAARISAGRIRLLLLAAVGIAALARLRGRAQSLKRSILAAAGSGVRHLPARQVAVGAAGGASVSASAPAVAPASLPAPPVKSLLGSPGAVSLPECNVRRHSHPNQGGFDASLPAVLEGWNPPASLGSSAAVATDAGGRKDFVRRFGQLPQYVKDGTVQPRRDADGTRCTLTTRALVRAMAGRGGGVDGDHPPAADQDLLFFTNDRENPSFFDAIGPRNEEAEAPPQIRSGAGTGLEEGEGFRVFSAMELGSSHPFHRHGAAWLGEVSGSRLWYLLPPTARREALGPRARACDYLLGTVDPPPGTQRCVQRAGEVMYVPNRWWHATCALEEWTVGLGGQAGNPAGLDQDFGDVAEAHSARMAGAERKEGETASLVECGALTEHVDINVDVGATVVKPRPQAEDSGAEEAKGEPETGSHGGRARQVIRRRLVAVDGGGSRRRVDHSRQIYSPEVT